MKWKVSDAIRFHYWEMDMMIWEATGKDGPAPKKPAYYDDWKQGDDPLGLEATQNKVKCKGGPLTRIIFKRKTRRSSPFFPKQKQLLLPFKTTKATA